MPRPSLLITHLVQPMNAVWLRFFRVLGVILLLLPAIPAPVRAAAQAGPEGIEIRADSLGLPLAAGDLAQTYPGPSVAIESGQAVTFTASIESAGAYTVLFDMAALGVSFTQPEGTLWVDPDGGGAAQRFIFPAFYHNTAASFPLDRYGNDALIPQERLQRWSRVPLRDERFLQAHPTRLELAPGEHTFRFQMMRESMLLGSIRIERFNGQPDYAQYQAEHADADSRGVLIELPAEFPAFKNDTAVRPVVSRNLDVTPYETYRLALNTLGGESWQKSGSTVYYRFDVPQDGAYHITLRAQQNTKSNFTVFRRITINESVPFEELNAVAFPFSPRWSNHTLGGAEPYRIYLRKGANLIGIEATAAPYAQAVEKISTVMEDINVLSLEIKKLTGNQVDPFKEWVISDYIPDIRERLLDIAADLEADMDTLTVINQTGGSQDVLMYQMAIDNLRYLANEPDKIPVRMKRLSEGSGSASQLLGAVLPSLQNQPLALDAIYIHSPDRAPGAIPVAPMTSLWEGIKRFFHSFRPNPYGTITAQEGELEVWVNRPRQYVDLIQSMADQNFTSKTGIPVKLSIMPNESRLILANAAGIEPDVALGVSTNQPYELAIRGALKDLRTFQDFNSYIRKFSPGALLGYIINDSVYALPETQDFWVTYYRKDVLDSLGIPVPHTWPEVIQILPELQRYSMNFNTALSGTTASKGYLATAPYLLNQGAQLYSPDGFSTGLGSDEAIAGMKFMAESFTVYGMPLTTANFYERFRYGDLPVGVANFETYIKLITLAPEIEGRWAIDLYPATVLPDGRQLRYATGSGQTSIMFARTDKPDAAWEFMKWWMSTETQIEFQQRIVMDYGMTYLWNSANLEAFAALSIPEEHKAVILEQWKWLQEPVRLPGSYMQEREISNAWNRIVFNGANPRIAIDSSVIIINREITRKMEEFGYLQDGVKVKEFKVPTIETVEAWMAAGDQ